MNDIDETHDNGLRSRVGSAETPETDFPIQNLPLGIFRRGAAERGRLAVAIGDELLDLHACADAGLVPPTAAEACRAPTLNVLMAGSAATRRELRRTASLLLRAGGPSLPERALVARADVEMLLPAAIGDYTDFYTSIHHATRVGALLRPDNPLLPNYKWVPIGYHGRASSIVVSGTPVHRPRGQTAADGSAPTFGPTVRLDYETEIAFFVGPGNPQGQAVPMASAEGQIVGVCLLNDWSARDVQKWEYQPLGPFLAKSFATSISPWVVTVEALAPFRAPLTARPAGDPEPLDYLQDARDQARGGIDLHVATYLSTPRMREKGIAAVQVSAGSFLDMYWTPAQMVAHHTSNGCNLRAGDLLASGTVSGAGPESAGCLLERTAGGKQPLDLPGGETRRFLEDGDEVVMRAWCARDGFRRVGFGECRGRIVA